MNIHDQVAQIEYEATFRDWSSRVTKYASILREDLIANGIPVDSADYMTAFWIGECMEFHSDDEEEGGD